MGLFTRGFTLFLLLMCTFSLITGCSKQMENKITMKRVGDKDTFTYIAYKDDIDRKQAAKAKSILANVNWEPSKP